MIVRVAPPEHYPWIADRAQLVIGPQFRALEAVDKAGLIAGMVGFDGWMPNSLMLHIALDVPIALRKLCRMGFQWAFRMRPIALAPVLSNNRKSMRLVEELGFRLAGRLKDAWEPDVDLILYQMRREECRFLEAERWAA